MHKLLMLSDHIDGIVTHGHSGMRIYFGIETSPFGNIEIFRIDVLLVS